MAASAYFDQVQKLYIAYFGRPADPTGLNYWAANIDASGGSFDAAINGFAASTESQALYAAGTNAQLVTSIYTALFNRLPEAAGLAYWASLIDAGAITGARAAYQILSSAGPGDAAAIANKVAAANLFTSNIDTGAEVTGYNGATSAAIARAWLAKVDATPYSIVNLQSDSIKGVADATGIQVSSPVTPATPTFSATKDGSNVVTFTNSGLGVSVVETGGFFTFTSDGLSGIAGTATVTGPVSGIVLAPPNATLTIAASLAHVITLPNTNIKLSDTAPLSASLLLSIESASIPLVIATNVSGVTASTVAQTYDLLVTKNGNTGDKIWMAGNVTVGLSDTSATASDLNAINAKTTGLITAANLTSISGAITDVKASLEAITSGTSLSATGLASVTLTNAITSSAFNNVVFANNTTITLANVTGNAITTVDANISSGKTLTIDGSGLTGSNILTFQALAETNGSFIVKGGAGADSLIGGKGVDTLTGGGGIDFFGIGTGGSLIGSGGGTNIDRVTDFNFGGSDTLGFQNASILLAADNSVIVAGSNVQQSAGGKITFDAADNTLALKVAAIQADTQLKTVKATAFFEDSGNTYVYYAGATTASSDDELVQLTGVTNLTTITLNASNYINMT